MKVKKILILLIVMVGLSGCYIGPASYEVFVNNMESNMRNWTPTEYAIKNSREIYDENRYIYIFRHNPEGCIHGILTNRDDKPEKAVGWIILSGKENCKERQGWIFSF